MTPPELAEAREAIDQASDALSRAGLAMDALDESMPHLPSPAVREQAKTAAKLARGIAEQATKLAVRFDEVEHLPPRHGS